MAAKSLTGMQFVSSILSRYLVDPWSVKHGEKATQSSFTGSSIFHAGGLQLCSAISVCPASRWMMAVFMYETKLSSFQLYTSFHPCRYILYLSSPSDLSLEKAHDDGSTARLVLEPLVKILTQGADLLLPLGTSIPHNGCSVMNPADIRENGGQKDSEDPAQELDERPRVFQVCVKGGMNLS